MSSTADQTAQGVFDLAANVAEWTSDAWSPVAYCAAEQPGNVSLEAHFSIDAQGRVTAIPNRALLVNEAEDCLVVDSEGERYGGQRLSDFQNCIAACGADREMATACIRDCFVAFDDESCVADEVVSVCGRRADERGQCAPIPWCVPRSSEASSSNAAGGSNGFVVRGAHFQSTQACEARPTARRGERLGGSRIGFRCVLDTDHQRCQAVQP